VSASLSSRRRHFPAHHAPRGHVHTRNGSLLVLVLLLTVIAASPSVAQTPAGDSWKVTIAPYLFGVGLNGTTAIKGQELTVDGFGAGSDLTWQVFPTFGVNLAKWMALDFGYRWLSIDYSSGEKETLFKYDVLTQGPVPGFAFKF
jgi:hypothetical protein